MRIRRFWFAWDFSIPLLLPHHLGAPSLDYSTNFTQHSRCKRQKNKQIAKPTNWFLSNCRAVELKTPNFSHELQIGAKKIENGIANETRSTNSLPSWNNRWNNTTTAMNNLNKISNSEDFFSFDWCTRIERTPSFIYYKICVRKRVLFLITSCSQ